MLEEDGKVVHPATGTPQGGIVSPVLANIYLHYVLDLWFEHRVKKRCQGDVFNGQLKRNNLDNSGTTTVTME